jgi:hypothetical protein
MRDETIAQLLSIADVVEGIENYRRKWKTHLERVQSEK